MVQLVADAAARTSPHACKHCSASCIVSLIQVRMRLTLSLSHRAAAGPAPSAATPLKTLPAAAGSFAAAQGGLPAPAIVAAGGAGGAAGGKSGRDVALASRAMAAEVDEFAGLSAEEAAAARDAASKVSSAM